MTDSKKIFMTEQIIILAIAVIVLVKSGGMVVKSLASISRALGLSEFVISFILMSVATTMPELFVGISSAAAGAPNLSLSNVIGSNIANLTLIAGIAALFAGKIKIKEKLIKQNVWSIFTLTLVFVILLNDGVLSRKDGAVLLFLFFGYLAYLYQQKNTFTGKLNTNGGQIAKENKNGEFSLIGIFFKNLFGFLLGAGLLLGSSILVVRSAIFLATAWSVPLVIIGIFGVAIGTSLPELTFGIRSALSGHEGMSFGNLLGSVSINSTLILGTTALISPITIENPHIIWMSIVMMILSVFIFSFFVYTSDAISRKEGFFLLIMYLIFMWILL